MQGDRVVVHYSGLLENGFEFDSSYERNDPFTFQLSQGWVIKCWDEGLLHLSLGMKARLLCPPDFAYGSKGAGDVIPPNSNILFDVELIEINPPESDL